jgi:hypothetical protein
VVGLNRQMDGREMDGQNLQSLSGVFVRGSALLDQNSVHKVGKAGERYVIHGRIFRREFLTLHSRAAAILVVKRTPKLATTGSYLARVVLAFGISLTANTLSQSGPNGQFLHIPSGSFVIF